MVVSHAKYALENQQKDFGSCCGKIKAALFDQQLLQRRIKDFFGAPDGNIDCIIRLLRESQGNLTVKLREEFPRLSDHKILTRLTAAKDPRFPIPMNGQL